jgi:hypothetical protein
MMNSDDVPRIMPFQGRKPTPPSTRSSPSPSFNYNYNANSGYSSQQHMRRKIDRFKRDPGNGNGNGNGNERLMRQNDLIIRLLKEIRDRLPPPPVSAQVSINNSNAETARQNGHADDMEQAETPTMERQALPPAPEAGNQAAATGPAGEALQAEPQPLAENSPDGE